jgi:hypothetical protein
LPPLPAALRGRFTSEPIPAPPADVSMQTGVINPRLAVYTLLLAGLIDGVARAQKFDDFLAALESQEPDLSRRVTQARTVWINGALTKLRDFVNVIPDDERRAVVNDLYVALCDACGPVAADRILAAAVTAAEQSAEARFASPREFI